MLDTDPHASPVDVPATAAQLRRENGAFGRWARGYGVISHADATQVRIHALARRLVDEGAADHAEDVYGILQAADRLASAGMWLVVHMTYARRVYTDGRPLGPGDFKPEPEGHTGGSLNMVPAYVGYLAANALSGITRGWLMGQGHCVSAVDAVNVLVGNTTEAHAARYGVDDAGLSRLAGDFYGYALSADGSPAAPLGSHVGPHTAGGLAEGGYLGFAELQYAHLPLPGERLVTFLSDGAFEEQRGADWTPRWWRAEDCGLIAPFMILNGRRIDQRSSMAMKGGADWLGDHLRLNNFDPVHLDGRDPAAFAWAILEMEARLLASAEGVRRGEAAYPVPIPYGVADTVKGFGFPGAGTNRAHNLPLAGNPAEDADARAEFNRGAGALWVAPEAIVTAAHRLNLHVEQGRPRERDNPLADRRVSPPRLPEPEWHAPGGQTRSPMRAVDGYFCAVVDANPELRVRVGNPDEMRSNRLDQTLERLRHRVNAPEPGMPEAVDGAVITALNEEAVVSAALGNKGGLNLVATYEAFAVKMLGAVRQELLFARGLAEAGRPPGWLGVPLIATSHTWENGKNERSHQDTTFTEALLGEMSDTVEVAFPPDANTAVAALRRVYAERGRIWALVVPKRPLPVWFTPEQATALARDGALRLRGQGTAGERVILTATGGYQLREVLKASARLEDAGVGHAVVYLQQPGCFRLARDAREAQRLAPPERVESLYPRTATARVFATHTRPEPYAGTVWPLLRDPVQTPVLGFLNQGGTLDVDGMLFANRSTWAHLVAATARALGDPPDSLLRTDELAELTGHRAPGRIFGTGGTA